MKFLHLIPLAACLIVAAHAQPQNGGFLSNIFSGLMNFLPRLPQFGRPTVTTRPQQRPTLAPRPAGRPPRPVGTGTLPRPVGQPPRPAQAAPRPVQPVLQTFTRPVPVTQTLTNSQQSANSAIREIPAPSFVSSSSNSISQPTSNTFSSSSNTISQPSSNTISSSSNSVSQPSSNTFSSSSNSIAQPVSNTFSSSSAISSPNSIPESNRSPSSSSFSSSNSFSPQFPSSSSSGRIPSSSNAATFPQASSSQSFPIPPSPASSSFSSNDFPSSAAAAAPITPSFTSSQPSQPSPASIPESNRSPSFSQGSFSSGFVAPPSSNSINSISPQRVNSPTFNNSSSDTVVFSPSANNGQQTGDLVINLFGSSPSSPPQSQPTVQLGTTRPPPPRVFTTTTLPPPPPPSFTSSNGNFNHDFAGRQYHLSWRVGQSDMSWSSARVYCRRKGLNMISLDDASVREHMMQLIDRENTPFIWAGARISGSKTSVFWENGRSQAIRRGQHPWSFAGLRGPQPDGAGSEDCLAILNDIYNDGVKFHDVGCHHRKPTICEA